MSGAFRSVSGSVFQRYLDFACGTGADRAALLETCGMTEGLPEGPDTRVDFDLYRALVRASVTLTQNPALPLRYPFETYLDTATIVGLIIKSSRTLGQAFEHMNRYSELMMDIDIMSGGVRHPVEIKGADAWIYDDRPDPNDFPELTEIAFGRVVGETRAIFGEKQFAKHIAVTHPKPNHADLYEDYWRCSVSFGQPRNSVMFEASWLQTELPGANTYAFGLFSDKAAALYADLERSHDLRGKVEAKLIPLLHQGHTDIDEIAHDLGMSRSTLYRQLKEEGVTFAQLHDDLRRTFAIKYLSEGKVTIKEVAYLVGFSETSSFNRAFKRWTGEPPSRYLAAHAEG